MSLFDDIAPVGGKPPPVESPGIAVDTDVDTNIEQTGAPDPDPQTLTRGATEAQNYSGVSTGILGGLSDAGAYAIKHGVMDFLDTLLSVSHEINPHLKPAWQYMTGNESGEFEATVEGVKRFEHAIVPYIKKGLEKPPKDWDDKDWDDVWKQADSKLEQMEQVWKEAQDESTFASTAGLAGRGIGHIGGWAAGGPGKVAGLAAKGLHSLVTPQRLVKIIGMHGKGKATDILMKAFSALGPSAVGAGSLFAGEMMHSQFDMENSFKMGLAGAILGPLGRVSDMAAEGLGGGLAARGGMGALEFGSLIPLQHAAGWTADALDLKQLTGLDIEDWQVLGPMMDAMAEGDWSKFKDEFHKNMAEPMIAGAFMKGMVPSDYRKVLGNYSRKELKVAQEGVRQAEAEIQGPRLPEVQGPQRPEYQGPPERQGPRLPRDFNMSRTDADFGPQLPRERIWENSKKVREELGKPENMPLLEIPDWAAKKVAENAEVIDLWARGDSRTLKNKHGITDPDAHVIETILKPGSKASVEQMDPVLLAKRIKENIRDSYSTELVRWGTLVKGQGDMARAEIGHMHTMGWRRTGSKGFAGERSTMRLEQVGEFEYSSQPDGSISVKVPVETLKNMGYRHDGRRKSVEYKGPEALEFLEHAVARTQMLKLREFDQDPVEALTLNPGAESVYGELQMANSIGELGASMTAPIARALLIVRSNAKNPLAEAARAYLDMLSPLQLVTKSQKVEAARGLLDVLTGTKFPEASAREVYEIPRKFQGEEVSGTPSPQEFADAMGARDRHMKKPYARAAKRLKGAVSWDSTLTALDRLFFNRFADFDRAIKTTIKQNPQMQLREAEDPTLHLNNSLGTATVRVIDQLDRGMRNADGTPMGVPGLKTVIRKLSPEEANIGWAVIDARQARHAWDMGEITGQLHRPNLTRDQAATILEGARSHPSAKKIYEFADRVQEITDAALRKLEQAGAVTPETAAMWRQKYAYYFPLQRIMDVPGMVERLGLNKGKHPLKLTEVKERSIEDFERGKQKEYMLEAEDPGVRLTGYLSMVEQMVAELRTLRSTYDFAQKYEGHGSQEYVRVDTPREGTEGIVFETNPNKGWSKITFPHRDGRMVSFSVEPRLYESLRSTRHQLPYMPMVDYLAGLQRAAFVVMSVPFHVRNLLIRDNISVQAQSKTGINYLFPNIRGAINMVKKPEIYDRFKASGASYGNFTQTMLRRPAEQWLYDHVQKPFSRKVLNSRFGFRVVGNGFGKLGSLMENMPRFEEYQRKFEKMRKEGASEEDITAVTQFYARDLLVNYARMGVVSKAIGQHFLFFGARLGGTNKFFRAMKDNPKRWLYAGMTLSFLPQLANWFIYKDEEWYQNLSDWTHDYTGAVWSFDGGKTIFKQPLAWEQGQFWSMALKPLNNLYQESNAMGRRELADVAWDQLSSWIPLDSLVPTWMKPVAEVMVNKNLHTGKPIDYFDPMGYEQAWEMAGPYTTEMAKTLGETFNVSPKRIDHVLRGYLGSLGVDAVKTAEQAAGVSEIDFDPAKLSVARGLFTSSGDERGSTDRMKKMVGDLRKELPDHPDPATQRRLRSQWRETPRGQWLVEAERALRLYREVWRNPNASADARQRVTSHAGYMVRVFPD